MPPAQPNPLSSPNTPPPAGNQPAWYAQTPAPAPVQPKRSRKKLFFVIGGGLLLAVLLAGIAWYAVYSRPETALADALIKAARADHVTAKGTINADLINTSAINSGQKGTLQATYSGTMDNTRNSFKFDLDSSLTLGALQLPIQGGVVSDANGDFYVKVDNFRSLATQAIGDQPQALTEVEPLIKLIDKKWVKFSEQDFKDLSGSNSGNSSGLSCTQKVQDEVVKNGSLQAEVVSAYAQNQFINFDKTLPNEQINGVDNVHYLLSVDKQKAQKFMTAFRKTQLFKKFDDCSDGQLSQQLTDDTLSSTNLTAEVWIGRWDHTFSRIKLTGKESDGSTTIDINTDYRSAPDIQAPTSDITPFSAVKQTYEQYLPNFNATDPDTKPN